MARIRYIKPEFFLHEGLAELSPFHRLTFIGLWTLADRMGRLEDRPKRIKANLFPYDNVDMPAVLRDLEQGGFIVRYETGGLACIAIPSWPKHQRPHKRENPSTLPPPPGHVPPTTQAIPEHDLGDDLDEPEHDLGSAQAPPEPDPSIALNVLGPLENGEWGMGNGEWTTENGETDKGRSAATTEKTDTRPIEKLPDSPGAAFFAWYQEERIAAGLAVDLPPSHRKLSTWYSEAMSELNGDEPRLKMTAVRFSEDDYWRQRNVPFRGFMSQWRKYVPRQDPKVRAL